MQKIVVVKKSLSELLLSFTYLHDVPWFIRH